VNWRDVEKQLADRAEEVCRYLLPNGKRDGEEWVCGDIEGKPGKSFKVNIGSKAGLHCDFAGDARGKTFMALWCSVRSAGFKDAITEAKQFLGIRDDWEKRFSRPGTTSQRRDATEQPQERGDKFDAASLKNYKPFEKDSPVYRYLTQVRQLNEEALDLYRIGETLDGRGIVYPYFVTSQDEEGGTKPLYHEREPSWLKFELLERKDGKKVEWTTRGPEKCLFGKALIHSKAREIIITEGEKDAMAWASYGKLAVSVPFGAKWKGQDKNKPSPNREWIDRDYEWLTRFETIYICFDSDAAGRKAAMDVIREIGERLCRLVTLPLKDPNQPDGERYKDVNECLQHNLATEEMVQCLKESREFAPEKVRNAMDFKAEYYEDWFEGTGEKGLFIPIEVPFRIRRGEATIWTGFGGHGKSKFLSFVLAGLMSQGERACVASMEVRTRQTLHDLSRQVWGSRIWDHRKEPKNIARTVADEMREARENAARVLEYLSSRLWLYHHVGIVPWRTLLEDFKFVRRRYGVTQFVIDSLMRVGILDDDYQQQGEFVTAFASFCDEYDCSGHLVAHRKKDEKGERSGSGGDKSVVSGSAKITDNAHNVCEIWRNVDKGQKMSQLFEEQRVGLCIGQAFEERLKTLQGQPDGKFILRKQRNGEVQEASKMIWYIWESYQYTDKPPDHHKHMSYQFLD
jgi:twinkle protein